MCRTYKDLVVENEISKENDIVDAIRNVTGKSFLKSTDWSDSLNIFVKISDVV